MPGVGDWDDVDVCGHEVAQALADVGGAADLEAHGGGAAGAGRGAVDRVGHDVEHACGTVVVCADVFEAIALFPPVASACDEEDEGGSQSAEWRRS